MRPLLSYGVVSKGLLTFLGFLGNAEFSHEVIKKFTVLFVIASDAMGFFGFWGRFLV